MASTKARVIDSTIKKDNFDFGRFQAELIMAFPGIAGGYYFDRDINLIEGGVLVISHYAGYELSKKIFPNSRVQHPEYHIMPVVLPSLASLILIGHDTQTAMGILAGNLLTAGVTWSMKNKL